MVSSLVFLALLCQGDAAKDIYKKVSPSVVTIKTDKGQGSGFVYKSEGVVVTCAHVINDAKQVSVTFSDGTTVESTGLIDVDASNDVAAIKVRFTDRPAVTCNFTPVEVGEAVFLVGAPLGLEFSISQGIVGQLRLLDGRNLIQHSCGSSPGNSGGPLVNSKGEVIGIHTSKMRGGENLNFATSIAHAKTLDCTLATQRWSQVTPFTTPNSKPAANKEDDARIAAILYDHLKKAYRYRDLAYEVDIEVSTKSAGNAVITGEALVAPRQLGNLADLFWRFSDTLKGTDLASEVSATGLAISGAGTAFSALLRDVDSAYRHGWTGPINSAFNRDFAETQNKLATDKLSDFLVANMPPAQQTLEFLYRFSPPERARLRELCSLLHANVRIENWPDLGLGTLNKKSETKKFGFESGDTIIMIDEVSRADPVSVLLRYLKESGKKFTVVVRKQGGGKKKLTITAPR